MNRYLFYMLFGGLLAAGCTSDHPSETNATIDSSKITKENQAVAVVPKVVGSDSVRTTDAVILDGKRYSNKRFKDVAVERIATGKYRVTGKGQIFEANFGWYIEDGHNELQSGFASTDAGAPEWGSFDFVIDSVNKKRPHSKLHLVLYEASAKDGSRQHELPVLLY